MNLSLEVKKFMNNEHMGEYVSVVLPSELPVERAEVREVNRDKYAANSAKSLAENKARAAAKARGRFDTASKQCEQKRADLEEANSVLEEIVSQQKTMQPELESKRDAYEAALADYEEKKNIYELKRGSYEAAEAAFSAASENEKRANAVLNDCRAKLTFSEAALASAKEDGTKHEGRLTTAIGETAQLKVLSEKARDEARAAAEAENDKKGQYDLLSEKTAQLLAVMKKEDRRFSEAQRSMNNAVKEYSKASGEHSSAIEALAAAENAVISAGADNESVKAKAASQRAKTAAAAARLENAEALKAEAEAALSEASKTAEAASVEYNKSNELLSACRAELDDLRAKASLASSRASEAEAKYSSATSGYAKSQSDLENTSRDIKKLESDIVDCRAALLNAETEVASCKSLTQSAKDEMEKARAIMDENITVMKQAEAVFNTRKVSFENIDSSYKMAETDRKTQKSICDRLGGELRQLEEQLESIIAARDSAVSEAEISEAEAERRRLSIRTINAKYETIKIHFIQQGKGEDLILVHSIGQSLYTFRELIGKLSSRFRVTALDLVGFGYSEKPYYFNYSLDDMSEFIYRFMEALGIDYAHFFGFSMGAGYVVNFAKRYPDSVGKIVLLSPGGITPEMPSSIRSIENRFLGGIAARFINYRTVRKMLGECYFDLTNNTDEVCDEYYKPISNSEAKSIIRTCVSYYNDEKVIHSLRDVNADTLLLWGNEDKWHPIEMADMFRSVLPRVKYSMIRNAGHLAHEEKAEKVAQLIKQFIPCGYDEQEEDRFLY